MDLNYMKNKKQLRPPAPCQVEKERQAYYRACILEFQRLGYQDQYLCTIDQQLEQAEQNKPK